jgi:hypothetical protein
MKKSDPFTGQNFHHDHSHHLCHHCEHYCSICNIRYCCKCGEQSYVQNYWPWYPSTQTYPAYPQWPYTIVSTYADNGDNLYAATDKDVVSCNCTHAHEGKGG